MIKVSVEKCKNYEPALLREVLLKSLENINFEFEKGSKVLIKPNVLGPFEPEKGITTNPLIVEELCKILKGKGCEIYIGDSSFADTGNALEISGMDRLSKYAKILSFDKEGVNVFEVQGKKVNLPRILFEVDLVINFAKMKTHAFTGVTLCSKNLYGCIPGMIKSYFHKLNQTHEKLSEILIKLNKIIKPQLNFIDGIIGIEGNGPGASGEIVHSGLVIASKNIFAADIIGSEIMGFDAYSIGTNKLSGVIRKDIEVVGVGVDDVKMSFKKPNNFVGPLVSSLNKLFPEPKICFNKELCKKCHICEEHCPVKVISLDTEDGYPICSNSKCILCFCCVEMCPYNAVILKDHWTKKSVKFVLKMPGEVIKKMKGLFEGKNRKINEKTQD